jgi:hypothetical protein
MVTYLTFNLPNDYVVKLCFTRMTEEDQWFCQMSDEVMDDLQSLLSRSEKEE